MYTKFILVSVRLSQNNQLLLPQQNESGDGVQEYILGQRWISDTESQMGLGTVMAVEPRSVTIVFLATGETRTYSKQTAPLRRVSFGIGDSVNSHEGWTLKVETVREEEGLYRYFGHREDGSPAELAEEQLDNFIQLNRSTDRLFNGKVDSDKWFELRYQTLYHLNRLAHHPMRGIIGGRTALIPHQIYIAHEVANRYAPRVLLADEVGLGKTIEAGMILHHQLLTERAKRILLVVPESLVHQWFVEMLRRFNLHFSIFDDERCASYENPEDDELEKIEQVNPFYAEQLILCSLEFLVRQNHRFTQCASAEWDMLVVDEAHHLQWSVSDPSMEYKIVETLAATTKGVLLLTATPEQLGNESHFARLRLLDKHRFSDYEKFLDETTSYAPVAQAIESLLADKWDAKTLQVLTETLQGSAEDLAWLQEKSDAESQNLSKHQFMEKLLDRYGTGRVLFRNTRSAIEGFPGRKLSRYFLDLPEEYRDCYAQYQNLGHGEMQVLLCPEILYQKQLGKEANWCQFDSRFQWLLDLLRDLKSEKVLLICAFAQTALQLAAAIKNKTGKAPAVFHEGLSILERDRAAAYFADAESGSHILICSEIGSEGRNFQFAHHLILFDLPFNPDLLEQRIGRLDRIGQQANIQIHTPILQNSPQFIMSHWFHEGLDAFENTCPAAHTIFVQLKSLLSEALHQLDEGLQDLDNLLETTETLCRDLNAQLSKGRDKLLEYNSCRPTLSTELHQLAIELDSKISPMEYMERIYDCYGIDYEDLSNQRYLVRPGAHMQMQTYPGLREEGMTISYERELALSNEDVHFISWDHPLVTGSMELVMSQEHGNTALAAIKYSALKPGSLLLESIFLIEPAPHPILQSSRYLPPSLIRIVCDQQGKDHSNQLSHEDIVSQQALDQETILKIIKSQNHAIRKLVTQSEKLANLSAPSIINAAHQRADLALDNEISRLRALIKINPNVREEEINYFAQQKQALDQAIESVNLRLDALRVLIVTPGS